MELLELFAKGDPEAFETLFRQFQKEVYGWILRIVRDPHAAGELTIETFWRVFRSHARFDPARSFGAWARRIATNVATDHLKRSSREVALNEDISGYVPPDAAEQRDTREKVRRALDRLPAKLRVTAVLALIEEQPYEEIAEALAVPVGTVKSRIFKAVRLLRKDLERAGIKP